MNLLNIISQPYILSIIISIVITIIAYFIIRNNQSDNEEENKNNIPKTLLYTFIISVIIVFGGIYLIDYLNKNKFFQKGGVNVSEHLTIIADDVEVGLFEN